MFYSVGLAPLFCGFFQAQLNSSMFWLWQRLLSQTRALLCVRWLGLSFYRLEQVAPSLVIYAMSKTEDSNERSNLNFGVLGQALGETRSVAPKTFLC